MTNVLGTINLLEVVRQLGVGSAIHIACSSAEYGVILENETPITTKKILQKLPITERVAKGADISKCTEMRTGGSTGEPLNVFLCTRELSYRIAMQTRAYGLNLIDKKANILNPLTFPRKGSHFRILRKC